MADKCPPFPGPRFPTRMERADPTGLLAAAIRQGEIDGVNVAQRSGFAAQGPALMAQLGDLMQMKPDDAYKWFKREGLLDKDGFIQPDKTVEATGTNGAIMKTYMYQIAGGVKELGNAFLYKAKTGADATVEALAFAQQMKTISKIGDAILGYDQGLGRGMLRTQRGFMSGVIGQGAEGRRLVETSARSQNAMRDQLSLLEVIQKDLADPRTAPRAIDQLVAIAERVKFADRPDKIARMSTNLGLVPFNVAAEMMVNGLLSGVSTFTTNAAGVVYVPFRVAMTTGSGAALYAVTGGGEAGRMVLKQGLAGLSAMHASTKDALELGWRAFQTETSVYQDVRQPAIFMDKAGPRVRAMSEKYGVDTAYTVAETVNSLGRTLRIPSRLLLGTDEFSRHMASRAEVAMRGVANAFDEGIDLTDSAALRGRIQKEAEDAFLVQSFADRQIKAGLNQGYEAKSAEKFGKTVSKQAAEGVFQENREYVGKIVALTDNPVAKPLFPFVRTPLNMIVQGLWESTGADAASKGISTMGQIVGASLNGNSPQAKVLELQQQLLRNPQETARMTGQIAFTSVLGMYLFNLATQVDGETGKQVLSGGGPARSYGWEKGKAAQTAWELAGNSRYSLQFGGTTIPLERFGEPLALAMKIMADLGTHHAFIPQKQKDAAQGAWAGIIATGLFNSSFLVGLNDLIDVAITEDAQERDRLLGRTVRNYAATFTPFGGFLSMVERANDPYKAAMEKLTISDLFVGLDDQINLGVLANAAKRIPGNETPVQVDQFLGEPIPIYPGVGPEGWAWASVAIPMWPRKVDQENPAAQQWLKMVGAYTEYEPRIRNLRLTEIEQQELNKRMANLQINGKLFREVVNEQYNTVEAQNWIKTKGITYGAVNSPFAIYLNKMRSKYGKAAFSSMLQDSEELRTRAAMAEQLKSFEKEGRIEESNQMRSDLEQLYQRARRGY